MSTPVILEAAVSGEEIEGIIAQRLIPAIADIERTRVMISLLTFFLVLMKPDLSADALTHAVRETSQFACLVLSEQQGADIEPLDPSEMN